MISPSELAPGDETGTTPFAQQTVVLTKQASIELKWQANYWRAQYEPLVEREAALKAEIVTSHVVWQKFSRISWQCRYVFPCGEAPRLRTLSRIMWQ